MSVVGAAQQNVLCMSTPVIYSDVFDRLERDQVRYVVASGIAVVLHGYVRPVADLDIVIDRSPDEARHTMMTLMASGFVPTIPLPLNALTVLRMFDRLNREVDVSSDTIFHSRSYCRPLRWYA